MRRKFSTPGFFVPSALLPWLQIPRAEAQATGSACPSPSENPMAGVHNPSRLRVIDPCQQASGTVTHTETWEDGDWNIYVDLDPDSEGLASANGIKKLREWPQASGGAGDAVGGHSRRSGGLLKPSDGQHLEVLGAHVYDRTWGYAEIHPVYQETLDDWST
jgi:hypothetical protein